MAAEKTCTKLIAISSMSCQESATVHTARAAAWCTLLLSCVASCVRKPPRPPWQPICAIQAIAQQFTALRLAQAAAAALTTLEVCWGARWLAAASAPASPARTPYTRCWHSASWCRDPAKLRLCLSPCRPPASRVRARGPPRRSGNVTTGRHALAISLLSSHPRAYQAVSSVDIPRSQGYANHSSSCLTRRHIAVSICGDAWSKQEGLTPQPSEGPVLSAGHLFLPSPSFRFSLNPLYPCCAVKKVGDLCRPFVKLQWPWNVATLPNDITVTTQRAHLARRP